MFAQTTTDAAFAAPLFHRSQVAGPRMATARLFLAEAAQLADEADDSRIGPAAWAGMRRRAQHAGRAARQTLQDMR